MLEPYGVPYFLYSFKVEVIVILQPLWGNEVQMWISLAGIWGNMI